MPCCSCAAKTPGISHNPLESSTVDDMDLAVRAFMHLVDHLSTPPEITP